MAQDHGRDLATQEKRAGIAISSAEMQPAPVKSSKRRFFLWFILALLSMQASYVSFKKFGCSHHHGPHSPLSPAVPHAHPIMRRPAAASPIMKRQATTNSSVPLTVDFQVYPPVLTPQDPTGELVLTDGSSEVYNTGVNAKKSSCVVTQTLMMHDFAFSYGHPFVNSYTPPKCKFNRITLNLTVQVAGVQFDRLAFMYFGNTEIWRTSTAEPTETGVTWTYIKDVSEYLTLFKSKQTLIFDLDNVVEGPYNGIYNTTLTATFWTNEDTVNPADMIIPVSNGNGALNQSSVFYFPQQVAQISTKIPKRANRAVFSISANGQIDEEFWYTNVLQSDVNVFGPGSFYGASPYREVQLYIDGILAGVVLPFPIIFTGGISPGFWIPIVGIDAFDLKEDEIDITPWLPTLCDGNMHTFQIKVQGLNDTGGHTGTLIDSPQYWLVTGKIFIWLDPAGSKTTGSTISYDVSQPSIHLTQSVGVDVNGTNETLTYSVAVNRHLTISSTVQTASGMSTAIWTQSLQYFQYGYIWEYGYAQWINQTAMGNDVSSYNYRRSISYPIFLNTTYTPYPDGSFSYDAAISRGKNVDIKGIPTFPSGLQNFDPIPAVKASYPTFQGSSLATTQEGVSFIVVSNGVGFSNGTTSQEMTFSGNQYGNTTNSNGFPVVQSSNELFSRSVAASDINITYDHSSLIGRYMVGDAVAKPLVKPGLQKFAAGKQQLGIHPGA